MIVNNWLIFPIQLQHTPDFWPIRDILYNACDIETAIALISCSLKKFRQIATRYGKKSLSSLFYFCLLIVVIFCQQNLEATTILRP